MSDRKLKSSRKRSQTTVNRRRSKRVKQDAPERPVSSTKITDINDDCLEHIFKKLELGDLLNVADASKSFKPAVDQAYTSLLRGFFPLEIISVKPSQNRRLKILYRTIFISDLSTCLKFLRCFGHLITELNVSYLQGDRCHHKEVDRYLNKYCADSLHRIKFNGARTWTMENIEKPFKKVEYIYFNNSRLGANLTDLNKLFPRLGQLTFTGGNFLVDHKSIKKHFPSLYKLVIETNRRDKRKLRKSHFAELLRLNPKIRFLKIHGDILDAKFLHSNSEHLQTVAFLDVIWNTKCFNHNGPIHFRNVEYLMLEIYDDPNDVSDGPTPKIPFSFDRLKTLLLYLNKNYLIDDIVEFISMQSTLKILILDRGNHILWNASDKSKLAKSLNQLQSLEYISFSSTTFTVDEILEIVRNCGSMKKFSFQDEDMTKCQRLRENLDETWIISYEYGFVKLQR